MKTSEFDYRLPQEKIAQVPIEPRHNARLLVLDRASATLQHTYFYGIERFINPGDVLVVNQTRVIPARIFARKPTGGKVELLLLNQRDELTWETLAGGKRVTPGLALKVENGPEAAVLTALDGPRRLLRFSEPIEPYLERAGEMPLPPYITTRLEDPQRYQTVYARDSGSAAAPTAGLHFTGELLERLKSRGTRIASITLHVGLDTFAPVTEDRIEDHHIHTEWCELPPQAAETINHAHRNGGRILAVGTTSVRTLETASRYALEGQRVGSFQAQTDLFITPGYTFKVVDAMITNFHLPRSTLLMLVSAFAGKERILETYKTAVDLDYRFYSFGDAMLIL